MQKQEEYLAIGKSNAESYKLSVEAMGGKQLYAT